MNLSSISRVATEQIMSQTSQVRRRRIVEFVGTKKRTGTYGASANEVNDRVLTLLASTRLRGGRLIRDCIAQPYQRQQGYKRTENNFHHVKTLHSLLH